MEERLQKLIAASGIASRRKAEEFILAGEVTINGKVVTELGTKVDPHVQKILFDGRAVQLLCRRSDARTPPAIVTVDERITPIDVPTPTLDCYDTLLHDRSPAR